MPIEEIEIVTFEEQGKTILAAIQASSTEQEKKYVEVICEDGQFKRLQANRLSALKNISLPDNDVSKHLARLRQEASQIKLDLSVLWEKLENETNVLTLSQIALVAFNDSTIQELIALRLLLINDRVYFKRQGANFATRSIEEISQRREQLVNDQKLEQLTLKTIESCKKKLLDPAYQLEESVIKRLNSVMALAARNSLMSPADKRDANQLLKRLKGALGLELNGSPDRQAYSLLHKLDIFNSETNLALLRFRVDWSYPEPALKELEKFHSNFLNFLSHPDYIDCTNLNCLTIDDLTTKDMDDALSLEETSTGFRLGIHISNVSDALSELPLIEEGAKERASSVYYTNLTVHMLPELLACDLLSLKASETRPVISVFIELDRNYKILESKIQKSKIKVNKRYDYKEVDEILLSDSTDNSTGLFSFYEVASALEEKRFAAGGFKVPKKEAIVKINPDRSLSLEEVDENTPGRMIVGEFMILANSLFAEYAHKNKIPFIYRSQDLGGDSQINKKQKLNGGLAEDYAIRSTLKPSIVSLRALPHATLGVKKYAQVTSPIRRYSDLVNQRQISNYLDKQSAYYSENDLKQLLEQQETYIGLVAKAQKEGTRFWILKYLQQRKKSTSEIKATVLRTDLRTPLVQLDEVYISALCDLSPNKHPGDRVNLRITKLSPTFGELELTQIPA
jgi:exoribonuclease-2